MYGHHFYQIWKGWCKLLDGFNNLFIVPGLSIKCTSLMGNTFHSSTDSGWNPLESRNSGRMDRILDGFLSILPEFKRKTTLHKTDQSYTKEITIKGISSCVQSYHIRKNSKNDVNNNEQRIIRRLGPMSLPATWHLV